jgi:hypothetical protein
LPPLLFALAPTTPVLGGSAGSHVHEAADEPCSNPSPRVPRPEMQEVYWLDLDQAWADENDPVVRRRRHTLVRGEPVEVYGAGSSGA